MTTDHSLEALESELQSLTRVRNRLAVADDRQLPKILANLLPRLLAKFDRINSSHSGSANEERSLMDQINRQCTGIFSHALDRIRLARTGEFCGAVVGGIPRFTSAATTTMAITLVRAGLPFRASHPGPMEGLFDFSPVVNLVHEAHEALSASLGEPAEQRWRIGAPSTVQLMYRMSGWLLGDCIALSAGLSLTGDSGISYDKTMNGCNAHVPVPGVSGSLDLALEGVFHLVLDVMLYWPTSSSLTVRDTPNNADLTVPDNSTGISSEGLARMQSWNSLSSLDMLRQLKLVTLKHALVPLSQPNSRGVVATFTINGDNVAMGSAGLRKHALAVLFDDHRFPHGRAARLYWNHLRGRNIAEQSYGCTIPLTIMLLFFALGDENAKRVLNQVDSQIWEPIVGKGAAVLHPGLLRGPMPLHVAARAIKFIQDGFHLPSAEFLDADVVRQIQVVVALVVELQKMSNDGLFWGMQLMYKLYSEFRSLLGVERGKDHEEFRRSFYRQCVEVSKLVLALLPDHVDARRRIRRPNREVDPVNQINIDERFAMEGDQGHLDAIISNHRQRQKNRMLRGSDALISRRFAFEMISEIVLDPMCDEIATRELCVAVFSWVPCEEDESNDASKTKALSSLFQAILREVSDAAQRARDDEVIYALIPHLLAAACHDSPSARLVAIEWSSKLAAAIEPDVAILICSHLSSETHDVVSREAQHASAALRCTSQGTAIAPMDDATIYVDTRQPESRADMANKLVTWLEQIQREFSLELDVSLAVFIDHNFSVQESMEALRNDFAEALHMSGLMSRTAANGQRDRERIAAGRIECGICYEEMELPESFALPCGDSFCRSCWIAYLSEQLGMKSSVGRVTCPNHKCQERVLLGDVSKIDQDLVTTWHDALLTILIDKCDQYSSCPDPDCPVVACRFKRSPISDPVQCSLCSTSYCFRCRQEPHAPAECSELDHWNRIYSSSKFWIQTNTKPCPSCKVPIEKNQGCNHMNCSLCGADFCWLCRNPLRNHMEVHSCNAYNPLDSADNDDERRAIFFTERFGSHRAAELYCRERLQHYESDSASVADRHWFLSGDDLNDICDTMDDIASARKFLQYSYVSAWSRSLRRDPNVARFTQLQATLENLTERLSTLTLATSFDIVYHERRLPGHFRTMSFLRQAIELFMNRMRSNQSEPASLS